MHELGVPLALDHSPVDGVPREHLAVLRRAHHDVAVLGDDSIGNFGLESRLEKCLDFLDIPYTETFHIIKTESEAIFKLKNFY